MHVRLQPNIQGGSALREGCVRGTFQNVEDADLNHDERTDRGAILGAYGFFGV